MKKVAIITLIAVFTLAGVAIAKGPGRQGPADADGQKGTRGMFWEKERVTQALSLTEEEKAKLIELHNDHRSDVQDMRGELREQRQALRDAMKSEDFSTSNAREHFEKAERIRSTVQEQRFNLQIEQRQLLGQERFVKLRKMTKRAMEKRRRERQ